MEYNGIAIFGNANSVYFYQYIFDILVPLKFNITIYHIAYKDVKPSYMRDYEQIAKEIIVFGKHEPTKVLMLFFIIKGYYKCILEFFKKKFDIVIFEEFSAKYLPFFVPLIKKDKKIITTCWGSDVFSLNKIKSKMLSIIVKKSDAFTIATKNMRNQFDQFYKIDQNKIYPIGFHLPALDFIDENQNQNFKSYLGLPDDKLLVFIGYNGIQSQQHLMVINAIKKLSQKILDKLFIVLPMTYGVNSAEYIKQIEIALGNSPGLPFKIFLDFMEIEEYSKLSLCADIFVHAQKSDAFSGTMREHLYAQNIVLNASWLYYDELANAKYYYFDNIFDLTKKLEFVTNNFDSIKEDLAINKDIVRRFSSKNSIRNDWKVLFEEIMSKNV